MSDNTKQIILKTVTVIAFACLIGMCILPSIVGNILEATTTLSYPDIKSIAYTVFCSCIAGAFFFGVLMVVLIAVFGGFKSKPVKAEKFELNACDFNDLRGFLDGALLMRGFKKEGCNEWDGDKQVSLYLKKGLYSSGVYNIHAYALVRVPELTDELLDTVNDRITDIMNEYYNGERITDVVRMPTIVCVDRITPTFQKMVNSNIEQGIKNIRLPVGISFGGRKVYVAKQEGGFAITQYRKLRKEFIDVMGGMMYQSK